MQSVQNGLLADVRAQRLLLFGKNEVDIEAKSTISLLVDEVSQAYYHVLLFVFTNFITDHPSILCLPNCKRCVMVPGRLLLLRVLHRPYIGYECDHNSDRYQKSEIFSFGGLRLLIMLSRQ